ncbi:pyridoxal 5'-phosphate synthase glutaminase subunit PdxT [Viridibacillus soli]|uniref:pyridoxal 5'-phosphate synthase glutaminase subunit PdxT n=1 Tax=Viridibacillus soli TaxID=2798301 RepID=UPI002D7EE718|nr:pyridoxal 5'-phosphate synthase glutaminase subunit PdxT [Viridibacillus soli]
MKIGVLALQGAIREHVGAIEAVGADAIIVKRVEQLEELDGLVLPGGESTTMRRLIDRYGMMEALREFAAVGKPMFGTCAGLILLAREVIDQATPHIGVMNVVVERNSFGRQVDSFEMALSLKNIGENFPAVFIRAPHIVAAGPNVEVLAEHEGRIVLAREGPFLGCSFHPELTDDTRIMAYFVKMVRQSVLTTLAKP